MEDDEPSLKDALEGAANFVDGMGRIFEGRDPQTRKVAKNLDKITVDEAIDELARSAEHRMNDASIDESDVEVEQPHCDVLDTEQGVQFVVDVGHTHVQPGAVSSHYTDERVVVSDIETGWTKEVEVEEDGPIEGVERNESGQIVTFNVDLAGVEPETDEEEEEADEEAEDDDSEE